MARVQKNEKDAVNELLDVRRKLETADQRRIHETNDLKRMIKNLSKGEPTQQLSQSKLTELPSVRQKTEKRRTEESSLNTSKAARKKPEEGTSKDSRREAKSSTKNLPIKESPTKIAPVQPSGLKGKSATQSIEQAKKPTKEKEDGGYSDDAFEEDAGNDTSNHKTPANDPSKEEEYAEEGYESEGELNELQDIIEFLVYRLKGNRIARSKVESLVGNFSGKTADDFADFLEKEPFCIRNTEHNEQIMATLSDNRTISSVKMLRQRLLELLPDYQLAPVEEERRMEQKLAQLLREYTLEINEVLTEYEDSRHRVPKSVVSNLLHELGSTASEIDHLLSKLCLRSSDLQHLNYRDLPELFAEEYL